MRNTLSGIDFVFSNINRDKQQKITPIPFPQKTSPPPKKKPPEKPVPILPVTFAVVVLGPRAKVKLLWVYVLRSTQATVKNYMRYLGFGTSG